MADSRLEVILAAKDISGKAFKSIQGRLGSLSKAVFSFKGALGGILGVGGFGALVSQSLDAADAIAKTADKVGLTTDALQELRHAADLSGVATNTLDMAMQRFSRRLGEAAQGKGELVGVLKQYNIAVTDSSGRIRRNVDVLGDLAEAIKGAGSQQERLRIAVKAFDSEGAALVNMLKGGRGELEKFAAEARKLGLVLDEDILRASEAANDAISKLTRTIQARFTNVVAENADQIERMANALLSVVEYAAKAGRALSKIPPVAALPGGGGAGAEEYWNEYAGREFGYGKQVVRKKIEPAQAEIAGGYPPAAVTQKAKQAQEELTDFWRTQAAERYEIQSRGYQAVIDRQNELIAEAQAVETSYTDFWQRQHAERYEVASRSLEGLAAISEQVGSAISSNLADGLVDFATGAQDAKEVFADFARSTLSWLTRLAAQALFAQAFGGVFAGVAHSGGVVGETAFPSRKVNPAMFAFAPRLHSGLAGDEIPAILQKGETVLPKGVGAGGNNYYITIKANDAASFAQMCHRNPGGIVAAVEQNISRNGVLRTSIRRNL